MILRMQEPNDERSLEEKIEVLQSPLRQAEKMLKNQDYQFRRLLGRSCFLEAALHASQEKTIQKHQGLYEELLKECEILKSQISMYRKLPTITKSLEDMRQLCVKNEETLVKDMDLLQDEIVQREEDIKELNLKLQSVQFSSNEDRNKLQRLLESKEEQIIKLKKKKKILQNRLNSVNQTVELLKRESALATGVRSEPSQQLERLIEEEEQLEQEYEGTQKDLNNHEMLLSGHVENMTDSPTTTGPSPSSPDTYMYNNILYDIRKRAHTVSTEDITQRSSLGLWAPSSLGPLTRALEESKHLDAYRDSGVEYLSEDYALANIEKPKQKEWRTRKRDKDRENQPVKIGIKSRWEYPAEFVVKELWELEEFEILIRAKVNELQKSSTKEFPFDIVFMKCLNSFHNDLMGHLAVYSQDGMPPNFKYRDMFVSFENTMEAICKVNNVSQDFPVTICINAFRGYLDEFRNSASTRKKEAKSKTKQGRPKRETAKKDVIEHQGHKMTQLQFAVPTRCELCSSIIWITEKGLVCQVCKYTCHMKCLLLTTALCRGTQDSDQKTNLKKDVESPALEEDPESLEEQERVINSHIKSPSK